jgi:uncharacterized protein (UPF0218 family)
MAVVYSLPDDLRAKLKQPLGTLVRGSFAETMNKLKDMIQEERPPCIISVGDTVSKNLERNKILPQLSIIDNKSMRRTTRPLPSKADKTLHVRNAKATITDEAIVAIRDSLRGDGRVRIVVDGEEDLLTLVAILYAPDNSFVVYGQPYEGIVVTKATQSKKTEISGILERMKHAEKPK